MERIRALREEIDGIDIRVLQLLKQRVELCRTIGVTKREHGIPIRDTKREEEKLTDLMDNARRLELEPQEVKAVYREIIAMCANAQEI